MSPAELAWLAGAGLLAGVVSTVVSLASLVSYPALLAVGLPPLAANVTNTVALVLTSVGAAVGSRPELRGQGGTVLRLGAVTALGGAAGAALLLLTPAAAFEAIAPWLVAVASVLLMVQPRVRPQPRLEVRDRSGTTVRPARAHLLALGAASVYIGYFGAAGGVFVLVVLAGMLTQPLPNVNAVKNAVSGAANAVAALGFALFAPVDWVAAAPLAAGFLLGGAIGPMLVRRLPGESLRYLAGACGLAVAVKLGLDTYR